MDALFIAHFLKPNSTPKNQKVRINTLKTTQKLKFCAIFVEKHFLTAKTSTIGRYKKGETYIGLKGVLGKFAEKLGTDISSLSKEKFDILWEIYNKLEELNSRGLLDKSINYSSNQLQKEIYEIIDESDNLDIDTILKKAMEKLSSVKEREQEEDEQVSTAFTFGVDTGRKV